MASIKILGSSEDLSTTASDVGKSTMMYVNVTTAGSLELYESDGTTLVGDVVFPVGVFYLVKEPNQKIKLPAANAAAGKVTKIAHHY